MGSSASIAEFTPNAIPIIETLPDEADRDFPVHHVDSNIFYNLIQYGATWSGWLTVYDVRKQKHNKTSNIKTSVWAWDGSDQPGDFKNRIHDETSKTTVLIYGASDEGDDVNKFLNVIVKSGSKPLNVYVLSQTLEQFGAQFPFMLTDSEDTVALPTPFCFVSGDASGYPNIYVTGAKQFGALKHWVFKSLNITHVVSMSDSFQLSSKKGICTVNVYQNVTEVDANLEKVYKDLCEAFFVKKKHDILIIDSDNSDFGLVLASWILYRGAAPVDDGAMDKVIRYAETVRPDVDEYYIEAVEHADQLCATTSHRLSASMSEGTKKSAKRKDKGAEKSEKLDKKKSEKSSK